MSPRSSKKKSKAASKTSDGPPMDVYTGLLFAGFLAVATGCALLAVELSKYEWTAAS